MLPISPKLIKITFVYFLYHAWYKHQVVVKNLESNYRKVPGISAATILGDGSVALIVDVSALQAINREQRMANTAA